MKTRYLALLRGINVGGNNIIKMTDLKACFENMGFSAVVTYIQSGNVLFDSLDTDKAKLTSQIEMALSERFAYESRIVLMKQEMLRNIIAHAPDSFGSEPEIYRYDVLFLKEPLTVDEAMTKIRAKEGVDLVTAGDGIVYYSRLINKASQSYMTRMIGTPVYKEMTIRNWNTSTKLSVL